MVSLCLSNIPKVWWSELSGLVDFCLFLVGGKAGVWVESHHLRRLHQKTLRAAMTLQKKLSSAHSIRSWPSSEGTTWDPLHQIHSSSAAFLRDYHKDVQRFFHIPNPKKRIICPLVKLTIGYRKITMFQQEIPSTHSGSIFQPAVFVTVGLFSPEKKRQVMRWSFKKPCSQNLRGYTREASKLRNFQQKGSGWSGNSPGNMLKWRFLWQKEVLNDPSMDFLTMRAIVVGHSKKATQCYLHLLIMSKGPTLTSVELANLVFGAFWVCSSLRW